MSFDKLRSILGEQDAKQKDDGPQRPRLLIVDDDDDVRDDLELALSGAYQIVLCPDGQTCLDSLDGDIHAVILDLKMPRHDGFWTLQRIKERNVHLPVIIHSAFHDLKDPLEILNEYRPFGYVSKSAGLKQLSDSIASAVEFYSQIQKNRELVLTLEQRQRELSASQERLRFALEGANEGLWDYEPNTGKVYYSPRWFTMLGYGADELEHSYATWAGLLHPDDLSRAESVLGRYAQTAQSGEQYSLEFRMKTKSEQWLWILSRGEAVTWNEAGEVTRMVGVHADISHLKQVQEALETREVEFRRILEHSRDVLYCSNYRTGTYDYMSPAIEDLLGLPAERLVSMGVQKSGETFYHPDDLPRVVAEFQRHVENRDPSFIIEYRIRDVDGVWHWASDSMSIIYDDEGAPLYNVGSARAIDEQKRVELELAGLRSLLSNIIDSMPSIIVGVDPDGSVTHWNREAERILGVTAAQAFGQPIEDVLTPFGTVMGDVCRAIGEGSHWKKEKVVAEAQSQTRLWNVILYPLASDAVQGAVLRVDDVTERVKLEDMIMQAEKVATLGGLAAGMAHEINQPLSVVIQNTQVLSDRLTSRNAKNIEAAESVGVSIDAIRDYADRRKLLELLSDVRDAGGRAARIVDSMLSFGRRSPQRLERGVLSELVDDTLELFYRDYKMMEDFDLRHIEIVRDYDPALPSVLCEPANLQQVFFNLLKNAIQALRGHRCGEHDEPRIAIRLQRDGAFARIEIADNGPGIDEGLLERVFVPFVTSKGAGSGTGLGLSVSRYIVETRHRGTIAVDSAVGRGTTFAIRIPLTGFLPPESHHA